MKDKRLLLIAAVGIVLIARHFGAMDGFLPANARCHNCLREFHVSTGKILCGKCRHVMTAETAKELFNAQPGVPQLKYPTQRLVGPVPPDVTIIP